MASYSEKYIHGSKYKPRIAPVHATVVAADVDRAQRLTLGFTRPNNKEYELGRVDEMTRQWMRPEVTGSIVLNEYGDIKPFALFSGQTAPTSVSIEDMKDKMFDIVSLKRKQSDSTMFITRYVPNCYLTGFNLNMADPEGKLEQTWNFVSENHYTLLGANKNLKIEVLTIAVGAATLSETPVVDPDNAGKYALKAYNITQGLELIEGASADFTIAGTTLTVVNAVNIANADKIHIAYSSTTVKDFEALDDVDAYYIPAKYCTIELWEGASKLVEMKRLQSLSVAVTLDRTAYGELGNKNVIARAVDAVNVVVTLGDLTSDESFDQFMRDTDGAYNKIDIRKYLETRDIQIRIYDSEEKTTFLAKYIIRNLKITGGTLEGTANVAMTGGRTLESDNMIYTTVEAAS
jgi:hypothetical protein